MSPAGTLPPPICLREARKRAGIATIEMASQHVPWSPEAIGRHERGDVEITPNHIVIYANEYRAPELLQGYCAGCPIGKHTGVAYLYQMGSAIVGLISNGTGNVKTAASEPN